MCRCVHFLVFYEVYQALGAAFSLKAAAKIVQGESSVKEKAKDFYFILPNRSLSYQKIVQGERSVKEKAKDFYFILPNQRFLREKARCIRLRKHGRPVFLTQKRNKAQGGKNRLQ